MNKVYVVRYKSNGHLKIYDIFTNEAAAQEVVLSLWEEYNYYNFLVNLEFVFRAMLTTFNYLEEDAIEYAVKDALCQPFVDVPIIIEEWPLYE